VTVRHTLQGVVGLGTSLMGFRDVKVYEVLTDRKFADLQRGVKHSVLQRNGPSPEAHLSFFHNANLINQLNTSKSLRALTTKGV